MNNSYEARFLELYKISKEVSDKEHLDHEEVFNFVINYHLPKHDAATIKSKLRGLDISKRHSAQIFKNIYETWLMVGETGQGKSSLINKLCGKAVAEEGKGSKSKTKSVSLYLSEANELLLVDTPGLFDTENISNQDISDKIAAQVKEELKVNANIRSIFLLWCPNNTRKLRLEGLLQALELALGPQAINSVVFLVNKITKKWDSDEDDLVEELKKDLKAKRLRNPVLLLDVKVLDDDSIEELRQKSSMVRPFKEEYFESYRKGLLYEKYKQVKKEDEEKEKDRIKKELAQQELEKWKKESEKLKAEQEQMKTEWLRQEQERVRRESERLQAEQEQRRERERQEQERVRREKEKLQEEREQIRREREKQEQDRVRREEEDTKLRNAILQSSIKSNYQTFDYPPSYNSPSPNHYSYLNHSAPSHNNNDISYLLSNQNTLNSVKHESLSSYTGGTSQRFYKGGQFIPGGGHAPAGGVFMNVSSSSKSSTGGGNSNGGGTFYKGGQFIPGGGQAPKGGCYK